MTHISIVGVHCVKNDAMSNVMKMYSDWLRAEGHYTVKCYGNHSDYTQEEMPYQTVHNPALLLLDAHFQRSDIVIFQFGIYYPLMDLICLTPQHAKVLVVFHNITPKTYMAPQHHELIDKSFTQLSNLQYVDYVICDSQLNLDVLRAHQIQTPATVLPLWYLRIYGTPKYKPSFYDGVTRLVFLGRFVRSKGPLDMLVAVERYLLKSLSKAAQMDGKLQLSYVSNQDHSEHALIEEVQSKARRFEQQYAGRVKIVFMFNVTDAVKFQVLRDADIFMLPSYHEGFCVPVLEALSSGCRVVAYRNTNIPFVAGQDAHLAHTGDIESLTEQLTEAVEIVRSAEWWLESNESYAAFIERNSIHLTQFSRELAKQRFLNLLESISKTDGDKWQIDGLGHASRVNLAMPEFTPQRRPVGINALGFISGILGLGEAARAMVHGLKKQDKVPYQLADFRVPHFMCRVDPTFTEFSHDFKYAFNLIMVNPSEKLEVMNQFGASCFEGRYNIGLWYWELVDIIPEWHTAFQTMDELWVTTSYIHDNMLQCSPVPVYKVPIPIIIDASKVRTSRELFGLPEGIFIFVCSFDHQSEMMRKNPMAVVEAFKTAFGERTDVALVIKTLNGSRYPEREFALRQASQGLNIFFFDTDMERYHSLSLYATCDCYVSLHRAEGLGLSMAEAMLLGKPVIATGYSGNMEYMNRSNSMPVRYKLVEIEEDHSIYRKGQWWAEPDVNHAAQCMQQLAGDAVLCQTLGATAKAHIETHFSAEKSGAAMQNRVKHLAETVGSTWNFATETQ